MNKGFHFMLHFEIVSKKSLKAKISNEQNNEDRVWAYHFLQFVNKMDIKVRYVFLMGAYHPGETPIY